MFAWLFGNKQQEKVSNKENKKKDKQPKSKKDSHEGQNKWVQQALLQFLMSKQWRITLLNFVDNNCVVFDNEQENKFQYTTIHNKFKSLVAGLFDSVMEDLGIDQNALVFEIGKGLESKNKKVFEQLLYVEDFLKFKNMMLKRNTTLENEALKQLSQKGSRKSYLFGQSNHLDISNISQKSDAQIMKQVMKLSLIEQKERKKLQEQFKLDNSDLKDLKIQINEPKQKIKWNQQIQQKKSEDQNNLKRQEEDRQVKQVLERQKQQKLKLLKQKRDKMQLQKKQSEGSILKQKQIQAVEQKRKIEQIKNQKQQARKLQQEKLLKQSNQQNKNPVPTKEQIEERRKKLMQYRDLLKKKKIEERKQELDQENEQKVTTILLGENGINDSESKVQQKDKEEKIPETQIQRRRNLMKRIKNKIVQDY